MDNLVSTISPLVIDLAIAAIILLVACLRAKAGIYHCVMSLVVIVVAIAIGMVGSELLTPVVKENVWEGYYKEETERKFDETVAAAQEGTQSFGQSFKDSWNNLIDSFGSEKLSMLEIENEDVDYSDSNLVLKLKALALVKAELTIEKLVHLALFGVITALSLLILTLLKNLIEKVANFSIIGWVNHGLGFLLGFVETIVIMVVIVRGAGLVGVNTFSKLSEGTVLLKWLVGGDIQNTIIELQSMSLEDLKNIQVEDLTTVDLNDVTTQLKELVQNVDTSKAPEEINEMIDNIDVDNISEEVKEIFDAIDVDGLSEKAEEIVDNAKSSATEKAINAVKELIK